MSLFIPKAGCVYCRNPACCRVPTPLCRATAHFGIKQVNRFGQPENFTVNKFRAACFRFSDMSQWVWMAMRDNTCPGSNPSIPVCRLNGNLLAFYELQQRSQVRYAGEKILTVSGNDSTA